MPYGIDAARDGAVCAKNFGDAFAQACFANTRGAKQQHRRHLQPVAAILCQRHVALDVIQGIGEVGQLLVQRGHVREPAGLDLEALRAALEHPLISRPQVLVVLAGQLGKLALDVAGSKDVAEIRNRQLEVGRRWATRLRDSMVHTP